MDAIRVHARNAPHSYGVLMLRIRSLGPQVS